MPSSNLCALWKGDHSLGYHSKRNDKQLLSFLPTTLQSLCQRKLLWSHKFFSICNVVDTQEKAHYDATLPLLKGSFTNILFLGKSHIFNSNEVWYSWSINGIEPEESLNSNFVCFKYVPKNLDSWRKRPRNLGAASWGPLRPKSRSYVALLVEVPGDKINCWGFIDSSGQNQLL